MEHPTHIIDADGEVMIILNNANALLAPEAFVADKKLNEVVVETDNDESITSEISESNSNDENVHDNDNNDNDSKPPRFCIQVSAKHLTSASPVFKKLLTGSWKESVTFLQKGSVEVTARSWDIEAFLILFRIMHCQFNQVPRKLAVEMLAKVAVVADYYECKDVIKFFADIWIEDKSLPSIYCRELILWLWISWAFRYDRKFRVITATAMLYGDGVINSLGLPIPDRVIDLMNRRRQEAIEKIVDPLHEKYEALLDGKLRCRFECSSIMCGALAKQMKSRALLSPRPCPPFQGLIYHQLVKHVRSFNSPQ